MAGRSVGRMAGQDAPGPMTTTAARPGGMQDGAVQAGPARRVCLLVFNDFTHDSRVLAVADTFAAGGDSVLVVAVSAGEQPGDEVRAGLSIARLPFDPVYSRLWNGRARIIRPWQHVPEIRSWLGTERRAISRRPQRAVQTLFIAILMAPWFALTAAYHLVARAGVRILRRARMKPPWSPSRWLDQRYHRVLHLAPAAIRVLTWTRAVLAAFKHGSLRPAQVWHANDLETLPVALLLRRRYGGRVIYDSHEIYLEMPGPRHMGRLRRWLLARGEELMARSADAVVTINDPIADELQRRYGIERPLVIRSLPPLWSPEPGFRSPLRPAVRDLGVPDSRRLVMYHGVFQAGRGIEQLIEAARDIDDVAVVLLGYGPLGRSLEETARADQWRGRLALLPAVPPEELLAWLAGADISACLIQPISLTYQLASPNKLYQAIAAGVPLLATRFGPIGEVVERHRVGVTCDPANVADVAASLRLLLDMSDSELAEVRENARRAHRLEMNWEHEAAALEALYERLAPRAAPAVRAGPPDRAR
jgi:glycosyltransferase involved in cell wall biosynthesis